MLIQTLLTSCGLGLHLNQIPVFENDARFRLCLCGRRWGKSYLAAAECLRMIIEKPGCRIWIVSPIHAQAKEILHYLQLALDKLSIPYRYSMMPIHRMVIGDCTIECKSSDNPKSMRGAGLDLLIIDEACHINGIEDIWNNCLRPALADKRGKAMIISSPRGADWVASLLDDETWASWRMPTSSNPFIDPEEIEAMRASLPDVVFQSEVEALIVTNIGKAFNVLPDIKAPSGNQVYVSGLDWGWAAPFASLLISKDTEGHFYIHVERYATGLTPAEQAGQVLSMGLPEGCTVVADSSCFTSAGRESVADLWQQSGLNTIPGTKDRKGTIALLRQLLREGKLHYACELPNIHSEFQNAQVDPRNPEDLIGEDHLLDSLRYALAYLHLQTAPKNIAFGSKEWVEESIRRTKLLKQPVRRKI